MQSVRFAVILPLLVLGVSFNHLAQAAEPLPDPEILLDPCRTAFAITDVYVAKLAEALSAAENAMRSLPPGREKDLAAAQVAALAALVKSASENAGRLRLTIEQARIGYYNGRAVQAAEDLWMGGFETWALGEGARNLLHRLGIDTVRDLATHTARGFREAALAARGTAAQVDEISAALAATGHKFYGIREGRLRVVQLPAPRPQFP